MYIVAVFKRDSHRSLTLDYIHGVFRLTSEQWEKYGMFRTGVCSDKSIVEWMEKETERLPVLEGALISLAEVMSVIVL